jgi:rhamnosyltransferase
MKKNIAILLASYNGEKFIKEQLNSLLDQKNINIHLYISDDLSTDNTPDIILDYKNKYKNVTLINNKNRLGPAKNFYHILNNIDLDLYDYFALSDQDDIWPKYKIYNAISMMECMNLDGYSSDFLALQENKYIKYIKKSYKQKKYDYFFETPGPGCSFVLNKKLALFIKKFIKKYRCDFPYHDWLFYALARHNNFKWNIDPSPNLLYRQHQNNFIGANYGIRPGIKRLNRILFGDYYKELITLFNLLHYQKKQLKFLNVLFFVVRFNHTRRRLVHAILMVPFLLILSIQKNEI